MLAPRAEAQAINAVRDDWERLSGVKAMQATPGHGEIVGGAEHQFAEEIAKLARKKGGKDAIQNKITERIAQARAEGKILAERGRTEMSQRNHEAMSDKVVCGALATWEACMQVTGGLPPTTFVSGYTIARIMDVLNRHGYSGAGRSNKALGS